MVEVYHCFSAFKFLPLKRFRLVSSPRSPPPLTQTLNERFLRMC